MRHLMLMSLVLVVSCGALVRAAEVPSIPAKPHLQSGKVNVQPTALPKPKGLALTSKAYPLTSGSTSAEPLGMWVACRLLSRTLSWQGGSRGTGERRMRPAKARSDKTQPSLDRYDAALHKKIWHGGTHGSYKKLIAGETDLIYECRRPSEDERKLMKSKKVELDIRAIALDAFVFIRNKDNPVKGLTLTQVKDIYTRGAEGKGKVGNWNQVGGPDAKIHAYIRNRNSGSQETMMTLVMKKLPIVGRRGMTGFGMRGPYNLLHRDKAGIGFTFFYYQRHMAPQLVGRRVVAQQQVVQARGAPKPLIQMFAIDGVMPSRATIADGTYPLVTEVYVVTRKDLKPDHPAAKLRDWLLTAEGQGVVGETGYVPIGAKK